MNRISRNISIILRAERIIAKYNMTTLRNQTAIMMFAALVATIGLVMLNIAGFYWLKTIWSPPVAAFCVALVNLVLAALLLSIATRQGDDSHLDPATEVRDLAIEDLEAEMQAMVAEVQDVAINVRRMARDPLGAALPALAVPVTSALVKALRKGKTDVK